ncbi:MAG: YfhO family protein [Enterocloster clostridioformis]
MRRCSSFFLLYLGSRKITFREKAVYCTMLILFYASFSVNVLNFIWHGFHYPNSLPCRQSFIYIALMLSHVLPCSAFIWRIRPEIGMYGVLGSCFLCAAGREAGE